MRMNAKPGGCRCAIVFLRTPQIGKVKTRLSRALGAEVVLEIYRSFVLDVLETVRAHADCIRICYYPSGTGDTVRKWLGDAYHYSPQAGENLGDRMRLAFAEAFYEDYHRVVLLGTDIPDLPGHIIDEAFSILTGRQSVIGPALDGGYYLIGFQREGFAPWIFDNIPWGTQSVFKKTLSAFKSEKQNIHILPGWQDTDNYSDLLALHQRIINKRTVAHHTAAVLESILSSNV